MLKTGLVMFTLLLAAAHVARCTAPPTLPHAHHSAHPDHLHISTVREVIEAIDKMWTNYTTLQNRLAESERLVATAEERMSGRLAICDVEKRALQQVCELRLESRHPEPHVASHSVEGASCACLLGSCERAAEATVTTHLLTRLDNIWTSEKMTNVSSLDKAELTRAAMTWARDELQQRQQQKQAANTMCHALDDKKNSTQSTTEE